MILKKALLSLAIFLLLCLIVNLSGQIFKLWQSGKIFEEKKQEVGLLGKENQELRNKQSQAGSEQFIEEMAREKLGMAKAEEKVVILPPLSNKKNEAGSQEEITVPNWKKWWNLFTDLD